jgi:hypothetical protein
MKKSMEYMNKTILEIVLMNTKKILKKRTIKMTLMNPNFLKVMLNLTMMAIF